MPLQLFQATERCPATILELGDHRRRRFVVLLRADAFRFLSRRPVRMLRSAIVPASRPWRPKAPGPRSAPVLWALSACRHCPPTLRTPITVLQRLMRNLHLLRSSEGIGAVAPVPGLRLVFGLLLAVFRLALRRTIRSCHTSLGEHFLGLPCAGWQQQLPQMPDCGVFVGD